VVIQLNEHWRVIDDQLQWILQVHRGRPSAKISGWRGERYCRQRTSLLCCIRKYCGAVHEHVVEAAKQRLYEHPEKMYIRQNTVEHRLGTIKSWMAGYWFVIPTVCYWARLV